MSRFVTFKDKIYNNCESTNVAKVPRYRVLPQNGEGMIGDIVLNLADGIFYGHDSRVWIPFNGSGSASLSDSGAGSSLIVNGTGPNLVIKKLQSTDLTIGITDFGSSLDLSVVSAEPVSLTSTGGSSLVVDSTGPDLSIRGLTSTDGSIVITSNPTTLDLSAQISSGSTQVVVTPLVNWVIPPSSITMRWQRIGDVVNVVARMFNGGTNMVIDFSAVVGQFFIYATALFTIPVARANFTSSNDVYGSITLKDANPSTTRTIDSSSLEANVGTQQVLVSAGNFNVTDVPSKMSLTAQFIDMSFSYLVI